MTTTITPSLGNAPLFTQQGTGASPGYSAIDDRRAASAGMQEGVVNDIDFMVVQRAAGANLSVDIGMPAGGKAYVQGDAVSGQDLYPVPVHSSTINETFTAANATNPRIDQVVLEVLDNVHDVSGGNRVQTRVVAGTPTAGATLANRTGAATLPGSALLLADVLVAANATTITNTVIRDRRKMARGAFARVTRVNGNFVLAGTATAMVTATIECSGVPLRIKMSARVTLASSSNALIGLTQDGSAIDSTGDIFGVGVGVTEAPLSLSYETIPAAGFRTFQWTGKNTAGAGTSTALAAATTPIVMTVEEIVRQNVQSNSVTSG